MKVVVSILLLSCCTLALAADEDQPRLNYTTGKVVSIDGNVLTLHSFRGHSGMIWKYQVDPAAKIAIDGKETKLADLKVDQWIKVWWSDNPRIVSRIESAKPLWGDDPATRPATTQAAAESKPAVKDGLSIVVSLPKATLAPGEPIRFTVQFKNVSEKPFVLYDPAYFWSWRIAFEDERRIGPWVVKPLFEAKRQPAIFTLKPGETLDAPVELGPQADDFRKFRFDWAGEQDKPVAPVDRLPPGNYTLTIGLNLPEPAAMDGKLTAPFWAGEIATAPVSFEIKAAAAAESKPAVKEGLSVLVTPDKAAFNADEPIKFTVKFTNVSDKPFELYDADYCWAWKMTFTDERGGPWLVEYILKDKRAPRDPVAVKPGQSIEVPVTLDSATRRFHYRWAGEQLASPKPIDRLPAGRYTLKIDITLRALLGADRPLPSWTGQITAESVGLEIK